jgi:hypothetical protein
VLACVAGNIAAHVSPSLVQTDRRELEGANEQMLGKPKIDRGVQTDVVDAGMGRMAADISSITHFVCDTNEL